MNKVMVKRSNVVAKKYEILSCSRCNKKKPYDEFPRNVNLKNRGQKSVWCLECHRKWQKKYEKQKRQSAKKILCNKCLELKLLDEFYNDGSGRYKDRFGKRHQCIECEKQYKRAQKTIQIRDKVRQIVAETNATMESKKQEGVKRTLVQKKATPVHIL